MGCRACMMWIRGGMGTQLCFRATHMSRLVGRRDAMPAAVFCPHRAGFFGTIVEYGAERKISRHSVLGAAVSIGVPQGVSLKVK